MRSTKTVELEFAPQNDLEEIGLAPGGMTYRAIGPDPQFSVHGSAGSGGISPGWWLLRGRIDVLDGAIVAPRFYADYGHGYNDRDSLLVAEPDLDGKFHALVVVRAPLRQLRFDPTIRTAVFRLGTMTMQRMSRSEALKEMLDGIGAGRELPRRQARADFLRAALRSGPRRAAEMLLERYVSSRGYSPSGYDLWHRLFDPLHDDVVARTASLDHLQAVAPFSLVLPLDAPDIEQLRQCIASVRGQAWRHWRLHVAAEGPANDDVDRLLQAHAQADARIRLHPDMRSALLAATAQATAFAGMLGQSDILARSALGELAHAIANSPGCALVYTDEDRIDPAGRRSDPYFKPGWNQELLLAQDFLGSLLLVRSDVMRAGLDPMHARGDWNHHALALNCAGRLRDGQIVHVPKVLYHRRAAIASGAASAVPVPMTTDAEAVRAFVAREDPSATVEQVDGGRIRIHWGLPSPAPHVTIVIPTRDRVELLRACIQSVFERTDYARFDVLVVDNDSVEPSTLDYLDELRRQPRCSVVEHPGAFNFSALVNLGVRRAVGELVCLLNNDMEVITGDWLAEMASQAMREGIGAVGAMLYYPDDTIQHGGVILGIGGVAGHIYHRNPRGCSGDHGRALSAQALSAVTGACLLVRKAIFEHVGGFDESLAIAFNDIDFCLRLLAEGYRNVWTPHAQFYHHESASRGLEDTPEKRARFAREVASMRNRWGDFLDNDPAYNPNLTLHGSHFELAFPPRLDPLSTYRPPAVRPLRDPAG